MAIDLALSAISRRSNALLAGSFLVVNSFALSVVLPVMARAEQGSFESFALRATETVVSSDLLAGSHFQLAPTVRTFGFFNDYIVSSEYGTFEPHSDAMLRRTVREIGAIAALHNITLTDAYAKALKQAALGPVRGVEAIVTDPLGTAKAMPTAVFAVFGRVSQGVQTQFHGDKTGYEDSAVAQTLQMSSYKRDYAKQLGVDPYSSNPVLQQQLDSVSWAAAVGGLTVSAASMASGSAVVTGLSAARNVDEAVEIVASEPPTELAIRNRAALKTMGSDPRLAEQFLAQTQYSPRAKTILINALASLNGTTGKDALLQVAVGAPDEVTAIFYQQLAELLADYHAKVERITGLERFNRLVLAHTASGKMILLAPLDFLIWNQEASAAATKIASTAHLHRNDKRFELWITGNASPLFLTKAAELGIQVKTDVAKQLPLAD